MTSSVFAGPLPALGLLAFDGTDAAAFLQGQVTQDLRLVAADRSSLTAICSPQGRVLAVPRLVALPRGLVGVLPRELVAPLRERLQRYVLRARVKLVEPGDDLVVHGVLAGSNEALHAALPDCPARADAAALRGALVLVRLPAARALLLGPPDVVAAALPSSRPLDTVRWTAAAIAAGDPQVVAATSERWIPQMLNLDLLDAVNFAKGCYTGQEIVARTQHLGRIKRRMLRYTASAALTLQPGAALHAGADKAAEVVAVAPDGTGTQVLAVVNLADADRGLGVEPGGADLQPAPLPYRVPELAQEPQG